MNWYKSLKQLVKNPFCKTAFPTDEQLEKFNLEGKTYGKNRMIIDKEIVSDVDGMKAGDIVMPGWRPRKGVEPDFFKIVEVWLNEASDESVFELAPIESPQNPIPIGQSKFDYTNNYTPAY